MHGGTEAQRLDFEWSEISASAPRPVSTWPAARLRLWNATFHYSIDIREQGAVPVLIGYARTPNEDRLASFEPQVAALDAEGCEKLFQERVSSAAERHQLEAALNWAREGDTFVVTTMDRLACSAQHLLGIVDSLERKSRRPSPRFRRSQGRHSQPPGQAGPDDVRGFCSVRARVDGRAPAAGQRRG